MARNVRKDHRNDNPNQARDSHGRFSQGRFAELGETIRSRPYTTAAVATAAVAAGAFFFTRGSGSTSKSSMSWGQDTPSIKPLINDSSAKGYAATSASSAPLETASSPSSMKSNASTTLGSSPTKMSSATSASGPVGKSASGAAASASASQANPAKGSSGLDEPLGDQNNVGPISYGA